MSDEKTYEDGRKIGFQEGLLEGRKRREIHLEKQISEKYELAYARVIRMLCERLEELDPTSSETIPRLSDVYKTADKHETQT